MSKKTKIATGDNFDAIRQHAKDKMHGEHWTVWAVFETVLAFAEHSTRRYNGTRQSIATWWKRQRGQDMTVHQVSYALARLDTLKLIVRSKEYNEARRRLVLVVRTSITDTRAQLENRLGSFFQAWKTRKERRAAAKQAKQNTPCATSATTSATGETHQSCDVRTDGSQRAEPQIYKNPGETPEQRLRRHKRMGWTDEQLARAAKQTSGAFKTAYSAFSAA